MGRPYVYALVDVDAMYASCEQVLQPWLHGRPLVVLGNNDSCVIARCAAAKALGIERGTPWFTLAGDPRMREVVARSAHFALYGDFSARLLAIVQRYSPHVQPYSIDECYLTLPAGRAESLAQQLRQQIRDWLDLPVSIGLGASRTLAHVATQHAKTTGAGVCDLTGSDHQQRRGELLAGTPVGEVWGIAERLATRLAAHGITTAAELARADPGWARRCLTVTVERTVRELRGIPCLPIEAVEPPRQQCLHFRHLAHPVTEQDTLAEIAAAFAHTLARRLRRHRRVTATLTVHLSTGHLTTGPQRTVHATRALPVPCPCRRPRPARWSSWPPGWPRTPEAVPSRKVAG